jgi:hypothetical protein
MVFGRRGQSAIDVYDDGDTYAEIDSDVSPMAVGVCDDGIETDWRMARIRTVFEGPAAMPPYR